MAGRILIVGGGLGGLSAGIALRQAGIDAVVFERATDLARVEVGAGMTLWPNAMLMLDRLGVGDEVRARGYVPDVFEQRTWHGRLLVSWPLDEMSERLGAPMVAVSRPDVHNALVTAAGDLVRAGAQCTDVVEGDSDVTVELADGTRERGDLVIAADGIESGLRAKLLDDGPPRYTGLTIWRANVALDEAQMPKVPFNIYWGPGARFVWFRSGPSRLSWEAAIAAPPGSKDAPGESKRAARERFAGWPASAGAIIEATDRAAIFRNDVLDRPPIDRWGRGRITLLGDAAHPMTFALGQGAAQAFEDAIVLATCLVAEGNTPSALRSYEQQRMKRTAHFQNMAYRLARLGRFKHPLARAGQMAFLRGSARISYRMTLKDMQVSL